MGIGKNVLLVEFRLKTQITRLPITSYVLFENFSPQYNPQNHILKPLVLPDSSSTKYFYFYLQSVKNLTKYHLIYPNKEFQKFCLSNYFPIDLLKAVAWFILLAVSRSYIIFSIPHDNFIIYLDYEVYSMIPLTHIL